jgi:hypothetical protein
MLLFFDTPNKAVNSALANAFDYHNTNNWVNRSFKILKNDRFLKLTKIDYVINEPLEIIDPDKIIEENMLKIKIIKKNIDTKSLSTKSFGHVTIDIPSPDKNRKNIMIELLSSADGTYKKNIAKPLTSNSNADE